MKKYELTAETKISIHAPRTGSDSSGRPRWRTSRYFNPRSPHGERRQHYDRTRYHLLFQSTLPARGATLLASPAGDERRHFNPRSPHGERHPHRFSGAAEKGYFNPRSPHGERPVAGYQLPRAAIISIHAPRTGSDGVSGLPDAGRLHFNPRSPHGERPCLMLLLRRFVQFQSTLPARGATKEKNMSSLYHAISIHAPRTGSDTEMA